MRKQQVEKAKSRSCFVGLSCNEQSDCLGAGLGIFCLSQEGGVQASGFVSCKLEGRVGVNCTPQDLFLLRYKSDPVT